MVEYSNILVTGGAGFIGSNLVKYFVNEDFRVRIVDNLSTGKLANIKDLIQKGLVDFINGDIRDFNVLKSALKNINVVIHLAAMTSIPFSFKYPEKTYSVNVLGTWRLLDACAKAKIQKVIFISSCAIYGEPHYLPVSEDLPPKPISPYAESKYFGEKMCSDFYRKRDLNVVVLRLFNVYGPSQVVNEYSGVINKFIERIEQRKPLIIFGDGLQARDFVNVIDVIKAISQSILKEGVEGMIFNIGSGTSTSIKDLIKCLTDLTGANPSIIYKPPRKGDVKKIYADISRARNYLNYKPSIDLFKGLSSLLRK